MADNKDQNSLVDDSTILRLEKGAMAEKSLPRFNKGTEFESDSESESDSDSENNEDDDDVEELEEGFKKEKLEQFQKNAFYSVLCAFKRETWQLSSKRAQIIERLTKEWNIDEKSYTDISDKSEKDLLASKHYKSSSSGEKKIEEKPLKDSTASSSSSLKPGSSWGRVNPESLVGKMIRLELHTDNFKEFIIKEYDAKQDLHRIETRDPTAMEEDEDEFLRWVDIRKFPAKELKWEDGENPDFDAP